jgi:hypothetical protein
LEICIYTDKWLIRDQEEEEYLSMMNQIIGRYIYFPKQLQDGDVTIDGPRQKAYRRILDMSVTWPMTSRPIMLLEDSEQLGRWPDLAHHSSEWMEDAKRIAIAGYRQVLEDGPERRDSESDAEYSDHGEQWSDADMYTPEMSGPDGKPKNGGSQRLFTARANARRAAARSKAAQDAKAQAQSEQSHPPRVPTTTTLK